MTDYGKPSLKAIAERADYLHGVARRIDNEAAKLETQLRAMVQQERIHQGLEAPGFL